MFVLAEGLADADEDGGELEEGGAGGLDVAQLRRLGQEVLGEGLEPAVLATKSTDSLVGK